MSGSIRALLVTCIVAFAAGLAGVWVGEQVFHPGPRPSLHEMLEARTALSQTQHALISDVEASFDAERNVLEQELRAASVDLANAIRDEGGRGPRTAAASERYHNAHRRLADTTITHFAAIRDIMSEEQKHIFDATLADALVAAQQ